MDSGYISKEAKLEQKRRMDDQVGAVRDKLSKWSNTMVFGGYYKKSDPTKEEGDTWEDSDGKRWIIKNGIKQSVTKLQTAKTPWWCPKCGGSLHHKLHDKFYRIRGACHDCVIKYEGKMRVDGVWDAYERRALRRNEKSWIQDRISESTEYIRTFKTPQIHFENGGWEEIAPIEVFQSEFARILNDVEFLKGRLRVIETEEREDEGEQNKLLEWESKNPWTTVSENSNE